jgi:hypothetical protein
VYFPPLPANVDYLKARITGVLAEVMPDILFMAHGKVRHLLCYIWMSHQTVTLIYQTILSVSGYISMYLNFMYHLLINVNILSKLYSYF